jgi:hypothetical protein
MTVGLPSASSPRVGIVLLARRDFVSNGMCGGKIGSSGKMCTVVGCRTVAHAKKKVVDESFTMQGVPLDELVFICAVAGESGMDDDPGPTQVHVSPAAAPEDIYDAVTLMESQRTLDAWRYLFTACGENPQATDKQVEDMASRVRDFEDDPELPAFTPFKRQ